MENNINWEVFTEEERKGIENLLDMRMPEHIASSIINMDGAKEIEIQKIISQSNPLQDVNEEQLRQSIITEYYKEHSKGPQTPDEEAQLQKQLDEEIAAFHKSQQIKANGQVESLMKESKDIKPFCTQCDSKGVKHKKDCPTLKTNL